MEFRRKLSASSSSSLLASRQLSDGASLELKPRPPTRERVCKSCKANQEYMSVMRSEVYRLQKLCNSLMAQMVEAGLDPQVPKGSSLTDGSLVEFEPSHCPTCGQDLQDPYDDQTRCSTHSSQSSRPKTSSGVNRGGALDPLPQSTQMVEKLRSFRQNGRVYSSSNLMHGQTKKNTIARLPSLKK